MRRGRNDGQPKLPLDAAEKVDPAFAGWNGGKPKPSEPHPFESGPKGETDECRICGGDLLDPTHRESFAVGKARSRPKGPLARKRREARA